MVMRCMQYCVVSFLCISFAQTSEQNKKTINKVLTPKAKAAQKALFQQQARTALTKLHELLPADLANLVVEYVVVKGRRTIDLKDLWKQKEDANSTAPDTASAIPAFGIVKIEKDKTEPNTVILHAHFLELVQGKPKPRLEEGKFKYNYTTDTVTLKRQSIPYPNISVHNQKGLRTVLPKFIWQLPTDQHLIIKPDKPKNSEPLRTHTKFHFKESDPTAYYLYLAQAAITFPIASLRKPLEKPGTETL